MPIDDDQIHDYEEMLRDAELAMRGMGSASFGSGRGGRFLGGQIGGNQPPPPPSREDLRKAVANERMDEAQLRAESEVIGVFADRDHGGEIDNEPEIDAPSPAYEHPVSDEARVVLDGPDRIDDQPSSAEVAASSLEGDSEPAGDILVGSTDYQAADDTVPAEEPRSYDVDDAAPVQSSAFTDPFTDDSPDALAKDRERILEEIGPHVSDPPSVASPEFSREVDASVEMGQEGDTETPVAPTSDVEPGSVDIHSASDAQPIDEPSPVSLAETRQLLLDSVGVDVAEAPDVDTESPLRTIVPSSPDFSPTGYMEEDQRFHDLTSPVASSGLPGDRRLGEESQVLPNSAGRLDPPESFYLPDREQELGADPSFHSSELREPANLPDRDIAPDAEDDANIPSVTDDFIQRLHSEPERQHGEAIRPSDISDGIVPKIPLENQFSREPSSIRPPRIDPPEEMFQSFQEDPPSFPVTQGSNAAEIQQRELVMQGAELLSDHAIQMTNFAESVFGAIQKLNEDLERITSSLERMSEDGK